VCRLPQRVAGQAGTIELAGKTVARMGFGCMRLPGLDGGSADTDGAVRLLRHAVETGVQAIDTAWYYGDNTANALIAKALKPYDADLVIVTKLGYHRSGEALVPAVRPDQIRLGNENDRRVLDLDAIPLTHLRWSGAGSAPGGVTLEDALGTLLELQAEGKIQHIGLSNVTLDQLKTGLKTATISSVSNAFGMGNTADRATLEQCTALGIPYLPYSPLGGGGTQQASAAATVAARIGATPTQVALAWLLAQSPSVLAIPGTGHLAHLDENLNAAAITLDPSDLIMLGR
jgi:pyridoxine 4-dehydrogenase